METLEHKINTIFDEHCSVVVPQNTFGFRNTLVELAFIESTLGGLSLACDDWQRFYLFLAKEYNISDDKYLELIKAFELEK